MKMLVFPLLMSTAFFSSPTVVRPEQANKETATRLVVELTDGSRVAGTATLQTVAIRSQAYGEAQVRLKSIESIDFEDDRQTVEIPLRNGDRITGVMELDAVRLETLFGKVAIPVEHVVRILNPAARYTGRSGLLCGNPGGCSYDDFKIRTPAGKVIFQDHFSDGELDGWSPTFSHDARHLPPNRHVYGNWRIVEGILVQTHLADYQMALVDRERLTTQVAEVKLKTNPDDAYAGLVLWYKDVDNWVCVNFYPSLDEITVHPNIEGSAYHEGRLWHSEDTYIHPFESTSERWYHLKVAADGDAGSLTVYVDGEKIFTYELGATWERKQEFPDVPGKAYH